MMLTSFPFDFHLVSQQVRLLQYYPPLIRKVGSSFVSNRNVKFTKKRRARGVRKELTQEIIAHTCFRIDERENRIYVYDTVAAKKTAKILDWIGKRRLQCSDMVE